jgi:hypothetical protein
MDIRKYMAAAAATVFVLVAPGFAQAANNCIFGASTRGVGVDVIQLTVTGTCIEPQSNYKLTLLPVDVPGTDPSTLTLLLDEAHPGVGNPTITEFTVQFQRSYPLPLPHPTKVEIFQAGASIDVK